MQIHSAARRGDLEAVRYCLQRGVPVDQSGTFDKTPLLVTVEGTGNATIAIARLLLQAGADANARDDVGASSLMKAARDSSLELTKLLLEFGADPNAVDKYGVSVLQRAVLNH